MTGTSHRGTTLPGAANGNPRSGPLVPPPKFAQVEPVGECNLRCPMCLLSARTPSTEPALLPFGAFDRLLNQMPSLEDLHLQGLGEPLLHPALCDMVDEAARRGMRVTINTNLTRLTPATARRLARSLHTLHVSVDSADPQTYESIRSGARFAEFEAALRLLAETRRPGRPRLVFVAVLMRRTLHELHGLVRFAHRWGADGLFVQHLCRLGGERADQPSKPTSGLDMTPSGATPAVLRSYFRRERLTPQDGPVIAPVFARARRLARELGLTLRLPPLDRPLTDQPSACDWPWRGVYVTWQGELLPCCMVGLPDSGVLGRLDTDPFDELWNGPGYGEFRRRLSSPDPPEICRDCSLYAGRF